MTIWLVLNTVLCVVDKLVGISTGFVCHGQYWFVYLLVVFVMNYNGWYITQFCLPCTIMFGLSSGFVCNGQQWLVYRPDLYAVDKIGWYIFNFCMSWTIVVGISP